MIASISYSRRGPPNRRARSRTGNAFSVLPDEDTGPKAKVPFKAAAGIPAAHDPVSGQRFKQVTFSPRNPPLVHGLDGCQAADGRVLRSVVRYLQVSGFAIKPFV